MFCKELFLYNYIIPLGVDCLAANALKDLGFRSCSFPFDWLYRKDDNFFEVAVEVLLKGGQNFFDREDLTIVGQTSAPHFTYNVFNIRTGFMHIHDFSIHNEEFYNFERVKETYQRRMDRLIRILSERKSALFVCISQKSIPTDILISKWSKLIRCYNNDNIDLLVLVHDDSKGETEKEDVIITPHIKVVKFNNGYEFSPIKNDPWFRNQKVYHKILLENCKLRPKVSVILPTFNSEKYLKEAIDSILGQTFKNFELIIVDDYSTDRTREIVKLYKDRRIKLIDGDQKGLAAALNKGIRLAQGEYIARMDSDDISFPERFAMQVSFLDQNKSISLLGTWQQHFGLSNWIHKPPEEPDIAKMALVFGCDMCHSTVMFRKEDFVKNGFFYPEHSPQEDFELWGTVIGKLNVSNIPQILGMYRVSSDCISSNKDLGDYEVSIICKNLKKYFGIQMEEKDLVLVQRRNDPYKHMSQKKKKEFQIKLLSLYEQIKENNKKCNFINPENMSKALKLNWRNRCGDACYVDTTVVFDNSQQIDCIEILNIPFLKITSQKGKDLSVFLFNKIPLFKIKYRANKTTFRLFNLLPILTVKKDKEKKIKLIHKIFSIKNEGKYKIIRIFGLKIKFKTFKNVKRYYIDKLKNTLKINALPLEDIRLIPEHLQEKYALDHFDIKVRKGTSDISVVYDVLQKKVYACTDTSYDVEIIIDAGANIGCASVYYAQRYPNAKIYALEPEKENYKLLVENVSKYPNVIPLNIGLMGTDCTLKVVDNNNGAWGYEIRNDGNVINDVECCTVNSLIKKFNMKKVDILKIDIEGAEASVFQNLENINFDKIDMISIELHDRLRGGSSNSFFNAIARHPEYELDYVYTENLVFRKQHTNKL